jgi:hypothetical protein
MPEVKSTRKPSRYYSVIEKVFFSHYTKGENEFEFTREELITAAAEQGTTLKNIGDLIYSFRYRYDLPQSILDTADEQREWIIEGSGQARYRFRLAKLSRIIPNENLITIKVPDSTPEIIANYALSDEQALLAKVRYNRLIDIFLGITAYSLQNHLRTNLKDIGQLEIDEIYVGLDRNGRQFIVPVQAKGGSDKHGVVQTGQDIALCHAKFPNLVCRAVSAQFMSDDRIAMFELTVQDGQIKLVEERNYRLVAAREINNNDLELYNRRDN